MSASSSDNLLIQQLSQQSAWVDLIPALEVALANNPSYSDQGLLILSTATIDLRCLSNARELLRQALIAGVVTRREVLIFLTDGAQYSLGKARSQLTSDRITQVEASVSLASDFPPSDLTRCYRREGDPAVYVSSKLAESPLAEASSDCIALVGRLQRCSDRSLGSKALREAVSESGYGELFSAQLADVLRPFSEQFRGLRVLVLDSQCGAQVRFLAESGASVTAVTANSEHALLTAALCVDLPWVQVVLDTPHRVPFRRLFDLVIIAGYQELLLAKSEVLSPLDHLLERAYSALAANGSLLFMGHNPLALHHFNNQQDAYGREGVVALEGRFGTGRPKLLSPSTVKASLVYCGFEHQDHCVIMGSIKRPRLMVSPQGCDLSGKWWNLETLVRRSLSERNFDRLAQFSESRVMQAVVQDRQLQTWSDGYLFLAHKSSVSELHVDGWLASYFSYAPSQSSKRERRFCLASPNEGGRQLVLTSSLPDADVGEFQPYINGRVYRDSLDDLLQMPSWTFEQVLQWSAVWLRCLLSSLGSNDSLRPEGESVTNYQGHYDLWVPDWLLGATPERWIKTAEGDFKCLRKRSSDVSGTLPMAAVLFTGLTSVFSSIRSVAEPADSTWLRSELLAVVLVERLGFAIERTDIGIIRSEWQRINHTPLPNAGYFQSREMPRGLTDVAKLYWATETEGISEERTSTDILVFDGSQQTLCLPIATDKKLKTLRFDVANRPGCFEIEDMCVVGVDGEVLWRWRHLRDGLSSIEGASLVADVEAGRSCILSRDNDPQFVLNLPQTVLDVASGGLLQVTLSAWPQRL